MTGTSIKILLVWVVTCLIWGSVWLFIKIGLQDLPPISFAGLRLLIAVLVLLPVLIVRRIALPRRGSDFLLIAVTGLLLLGLNYGLVFWGAQHIPSGLTAVLQAATPAIGLIFSTYFFPQERLTFLKIAAILIGMAGVTLIFSDQLHPARGVSLLGSVAVVAGAFCVAFSYVAIKARGTHLHPLMLITGQMIFGMVPLLVIGFYREGSPAGFRWTTTAVTALLYLALAGSIAAFGLNYWLLKRMNASKILLMSIVQPLVAVLLGWAVLGERLAGKAVWGGLCILISIGLTFSVAETKKKAAD